MDATAEILNRLNETALQDELKASLSDLLVASQPMLSDKPHVAQAWRLKRLLKHLVGEICDPATSVHWWELTMFLMADAARSIGEDGREVAQLVDRVHPLLSAHFGTYDPVTLEKISMETVMGICALSETLRPPQSIMVAPNVVSLAQAHFNEYSWFRAIYAGKAPVGFIMIVDDDKTPEYFLWRFMIASMFQGRGYGKQAIERLVEYVCTRPGAKELRVSCGEGPGSPEGFYRRMGFVPTGEKIDDEIVLKMAL